MEFLSKHNSNTIKLDVLQCAGMFQRCKTTEEHGWITERVKWECKMTTERCKTTTN